MQQIAVRAVYFGDLEPGFQRTLGGRPEVVDDLRDVLGRRLPWARVVTERNRARADCLPASGVLGRQGLATQPGSSGRGLAPRVSQLDARDGSEGRDLGDDLRQRVGLGVVPNAQVRRADATLGAHRGGFGDDQSGTADRPAHQVGAMPVARDADVVAGLVGRVLAHRCHPHPVREGDVAQGQRLEQHTHRWFLRSSDSADGESTIFTLCCNDAAMQLHSRPPLVCSS